MIAEVAWSTYGLGVPVVIRLSYVRLRSLVYDRMINEYTTGRPHRITPRQLANADHWYSTYEFHAVVFKSVAMGVFWPVTVPVGMLFAEPRPKGLEKVAVDAVENHKLQERIRELEQENERFRHGLR